MLGSLSPATFLRSLGQRVVYVAREEFVVAGLLVARIPTAYRWPPTGMFFFRGNIGYFCCTKSEVSFLPTWQIARGDAASIYRKRVYRTFLIFPR